MLAPEGPFSGRPGLQVVSTDSGRTALSAAAATLGLLEGLRDALRAPCSPHPVLGVDYARAELLGATGASLLWVRT